MSDAFSDRGAHHYNAYKEIKAPDKKKVVAKKGKK